ncbi:MAG TPA: hypothetical protein VKR30_00560 [Candidatus Limnocylindrales bacterium]|nr:hypothetical protein [Candidatus Limnocylindrales bacterium]
MTLERAITDVLGLEPSIPRSRVMIAAASAGLRLLEMTDHEQRLARLEAAAASGSRRPPVRPKLRRVAEEVAERIGTSVDAVLEEADRRLDEAR